MVGYLSRLCQRFCLGQWKIHAFVTLSLLSCGGPLAAEGKRLYVEPFTTKSGQENFRAEMMAELRKQGGIELAASSQQADAILVGGGEIWVRGYRSLNPRSGRLPSDGTPVYAGYLSVELRNRRGETFWSYVATPEPGSENVPRDLAKRIAKQVAGALARDETAPPTAASSQPLTALRGAGATFPYPVYEKWFTNYRREAPGLEISYEPVGSEAGVRKLLDGSVDFAASDSPEVIHQLSPGGEGKYLLFPSVVGTVMPIANLPGFTGDLAFTPETLAGIYLGKIRKWNDPLIKQVNRGLQLPDLEITVVHRADGSGTSYAWTDFLSKTVPEWRTEVGPSLTPQWPVGRGANGNEGVASMVKELGGSIGYVEYIYALRQHLAFGKIRNRAGEFVSASLESIAAAVNHSAPAGDDFKMSLVNAPGAGSYPIASFSWLVVPAHIPDPAKGAAIAGFLNWILGPGQAQAAALGYLALPKELVSRERAAIGKLQ